MTTAASISRATRISFLTLGVLIGIAQPARADLTAFLGVTSGQENRMARGFAGGLGMAIIGFEFEYASSREDEAARVPSLRTWSGNVLLQTPTAFTGFQLYGTAGVGAYRETLDNQHETSSALNLGGGAKIRVAGPLRLRLDYRVFRLQGSPASDTYQRFYAGANLAF